VSVQNNGPTREHLPENCCKIAYEFNVQQQDAIPNLIVCWKAAFELILKELKYPTDSSDLVNFINTWWKNSPLENGVSVQCQIVDENCKKKRNPEYSSQCSRKHLPSILNNLRFRYKKMDEKSKRNPETSGIVLTSEKMFNKLIKQNGKCFYTGIPFSTSRNDWRYFSLERLNNDLNHTDENTVFICRMFNTAGQLNKSKILTALLSQIQIPISDEDKRTIIVELNSL
jgi:hypothetical protein